MSAVGFTEKSFSTIDTDRHSSRTAHQWKNVIGIMEDEQFLRVKRKLDFFRSMGLELCKSSVLNDDNNNNDCVPVLATQHKSARPLVPLKMNKVSVDPPVRNSGLKSECKQKHNETSETGDMPDYLKLISHIRECSVTIIGDKCKVCGKNFKCIKDVQSHTRKKHRKRKPRKKLVLKIGDEVITKVSIKRKHLKCFHRDDNDVMIVDSEKTGSLCNKDHSDNYRGRHEGTIPFVDLDSDCDINYAKSPLREIKNDLLKDVKREPSGNDKQYMADDDEEIQVLLKITRSRESGPEMEINHETPNRTERELLISDAIREFVRMDTEEIEIIESDDDDLEHESSTNSCRLANENSPNSHLDLEERNCSFHIENMDDMECSIDAVNPTIKENYNATLNDEKSLLLYKGFAKRSVDKMIPNLKEFEQSLNNPSNGYETDAPFYTDVLNDWNNLRGNLNSIKCTSDYTNATMAPTVLIKEEIMLDDF